MVSVFCMIALLPSALLLALALIPGRLLDRSVRSVESAAHWLSGANAVAAGLTALLVVFRGPLLVTPDYAASSALTLLLDGVSTLMWTLAAFIGWVICRFSIRYLDGELQRGRFFRWAGVTVGSITVFVLSGNLLLTLAGLLMTSLGLHRLLTYHSDRRDARVVANAAFACSRLGDVCLFAAAALLYREFHTFQLVELFRQVAAVESTPLAKSSSLIAVEWLIAACAILKSVQLPFHSWLPGTMEAPTPVSALMHAGIVNAGGFLLIRTSGLFTGVSSALLVVCVLGAVTAVAAAVIMLTQTSVKQRLAWSTIAQMGFMMMQCGLGAFTAAMLHIVAHSLYKAWAFLASGTVSFRSSMARPVAPEHQTPAVQAYGLMRSGVLILAMYAGIGLCFGIGPISKPGAVVLGGVLCAGLAVWLRPLLQLERAIALRAIMLSAGLIILYHGSYMLTETFIAASVGTTLQTSGSFLAVVITIAVFLLVPALEILRHRSGTGAMTRRLYVHASHGFYIDSFWRRAATILNS